MKVHLIGICGTGMGSLAGLLKQAGHEVTGSDANAFPPISTMLRARGIPVREGYDASHVIAGVRPDLVVVGNIARRDNVEAVAARDAGIESCSMPQAIARFFLEDRPSIVVGGTHGKTTTTALIARMLLAAGKDASFLVGGVIREIDTSYRLGAPGSPFVIEGDEYETAWFDKGSKFLHYLPRTGVLTSVEFDHAEMFADLAAVKEAFSRFVALIPPATQGGLLAVCADDPVALTLARACSGRVVPYGISTHAECVGRVTASGPEGMRFAVTDRGQDAGEFRLRLTGEHNLRNALAAFVVGRSLGLSTEAIGTGLEAFDGVRRRQEVRGIVDEVVVIDDFAHHPTAVRETIRAMKAAYPGRPVRAVFEPRTNTSRRDVFQQDYARAFDAADHVILAPVDQPERAPEGHRLDVEQLAADLEARVPVAEALPGVDAIVRRLALVARPGDVVLIMSNGAFGGIHEKLIAALEARAAERGAARAGS